MTAFYRRDGDVLHPSELTRGPWDAGAQHAGPPAALLGQALERDGWLVGRITIEVLRPVPLAPLTVSASVARPGRNVELAQASLQGAEGGEELARATAWRLRRDEDAVVVPEDPPPPPPEHGTERPFFPTGEAVGYHTAMDYRFLSGSFLDAGPAVVWLRMRQPLVAGEPTSPLARVLVAADSGNGVSCALDFRRFLFINTELTVHLTREPAGEWVCLDAVTRPGTLGVGLAEAVLSDEAGRLGRSAQTLLVRAR
ncbi:MAG TPA: thioesterase family protein [Solirubrobacteraceae bacterium]|nr:thioesterase family protein [Solirubrobacteraceae bacterium]